MSAILLTVTLNSWSLHNLRSSRLWICLMFSFAFSLGWILLSFLGFRPVIKNWPYPWLDWFVIKRLSSSESPLILHYSLLLLVISEIYSLNELPLYLVVGRLFSTTSQPISVISRCFPTFLYLFEFISWSPSISSYCYCLTLTSYKGFFNIWREADLLTSIGAINCWLSSVVKPLKSYNFRPLVSNFCWINCLPISL